MVSRLLLGSSATVLCTRGGNQQHRQALSLHSTPQLLVVGDTEGEPSSSNKGKARGKGKGADDESYNPRAKTVSMTEKDKPDMLDLVRAMYDTAL